MDKKLRVGIIGCGGIANGKHMPSLKAIGRVDMVAFCDIIVEKAEKAAKEYGTADAKVYVDYRELLQDSTIDVVHVCTPNKSHAQISIDALHAGKHVMCEKPMAKTAADAKRMVEAAKETGKKLTIGYQHRHKPESTYLKKDIGTHSLDLTLWMMNNYKPKMVVGTKYKKLPNPDCANPWGGWDVNQHTVEDSAFGFIVMEDGATIILKTSWCLNTIEPVPEGSFAICGTKAGAQIKDGVSINKDEFGKLVDIRPDMKAGGVAFYDGVAENPAITEASRWIDAIENDTDPVVKPEEACVVSQILEAIYESAKTGKPVYFNE